MASDRQINAFAFGEYELVPARHELRRHGEVQTVSPQVFALLRYLIEEHDRVIGKDELNEQIWNGRFVSDASLSTCVRLARRAIGDDGRRQDYIRTVPRRGYRFVGKVARQILCAPDTPSKAAAEASSLYKPPEKPSLAVLPFDNLTGDEAEGYISDGLTETIIAVLSTSPHLVVAARNSAFTFKGRPVHMREVADTLGVRYVLEGSVQRAASILRVTAQLIDTKDGNHLWAERYDRERDDTFEMQDEIADRILEEIDVRLTKGEQARLWHEVAGDLESYRLHIQGMAQFQTWSAEGHSAAEKMWSELYRRKPESSLGNNLMAWIHWQKVNLDISQDPDIDLKRARTFADKHVTLCKDPKRIGYGLLANLDLCEGSFDSAIANADLAVQMQPASGTAHALAGAIKATAGAPEEGIALMKEAMRLEPKYPEYLLRETSFALMSLGRYDEARKIDEGILSAKSQAPVMHRTAYLRIAAVAAFAGEMERARDHLVNALSSSPNVTVSSITRALRFRKDQNFVARYVDALRRAGLPEG